jgi:uncharacterized protein (UPF0212 family)
MKGFREPVNIDVDAIVELISAIEVRTNESATEAERTIAEIKAASKNATHVYVHLFIPSSATPQETERFISYFVIQGTALSRCSPTSRCLWRATGQLDQAGAH